MDFDVELSSRAKSLNDQGDTGEYTVMRLLESQARNVELLAHLASYSELLVAVTGPEGAGKSVIANALAAQREMPEDTLFLTASVMLGMPSILSSIANHWDMPAIHEDGTQSREAIKKEAVARAEDGGNLLLIIDQADQLDPDTLNDIAHFALLAPQAISFALFGLPGYETGFRNSPAQAPVHILTVEPLSDHEAGALIANVYGDGEVCPLNATELEQAVMRSNALPGPLLVASEALLANPALTANTRSSGFPLRNILGIAAIATIVIMLLVYQLSGSESESVLQTPIASEEVGKGESTTDYNYPTSNQDVSSSVKKVDTVDLNVASVAPSSDGVTTEVIAPKINASTTAGASELETVKKLPSEPVVNDRAVSSPVVTTSELTSDVVKPQPSYTADEVALLKPERGYIVQLLGSSSANGASAFKSEWQERVTGTLYQYETVYSGKAWFVVVSGIYSSQAEARAAVNALPPKLRSQAPWVRPITDVQSVLR